MKLVMAMGYCALVMMSLDRDINMWQLATAATTWTLLCTGYVGTRIITELEVSNQQLRAEKELIRQRMTLLHQGLLQCDCSCIRFKPNGPIDQCIRCVVLDTVKELPL